MGPILGVLAGNGRRVPRTDPVMRKKMDELAKKNRDLMKSIDDNQKQFIKVQQQIQKNEEQRQKDQKRREQEVSDLKQKYEKDAAKLAKELEDQTAKHEAEIRRADKQREKDNESWAGQLSQVKADSDRLASKMSTDLLSYQLETQIKELSYQRKAFDKLCEEYAQQLGIIMGLQNKIFAEEARLSEFIDLRHDKSCMRIVLYGATGHGKSSTACRLVGDQTEGFTDGGFPVSNSTASETQTINAVVVDPSDSKVRHMSYRKKFLVIDQPGTGDTGGAAIAMQHVNRMVQYLKGIEFINCVCIVQSGMDPRLSEGTQQMLRELHSNFGDAIWPHVMLVITKVRSIYDYAGDIERGRKAIAATEEWVGSIQGEIRTMFGLNPRIAPLQHIIIDNVFQRDYIEKCRTLINDIATKFERNPFRCDDLVSPLDKWRSEVTLKDNHMRDTRAELEKSVNTMNVLIKAIHSTGDELKSKGSIIKVSDKCMTMGMDVSLLCGLNLEEVLGRLSRNTPAAEVSEVAMPKPRRMMPIYEDEKKDDIALDFTAPAPYTELDEGQTLYEGAFDDDDLSVLDGGLSTGSTCAVASEPVIPEAFSSGPSTQIASPPPASTMGALDGEIDDELRDVLRLSMFDK